jgi:hypothetical protein
MIRNKSLFSSFHPEPICIQTGNPGAPLIATGHGTASIVFNKRVIRLENCLLVLTISQQLISLVQLLDSTLVI